MDNKEKIYITLIDIDYEVVEIDNLQNHLQVFATLRYGYEYHVVVLSNKQYLDGDVLFGDSFAIDYDGENGNVPDNIINDFRDSDLYDDVIDYAKQKLANLNKTNY